MEKAKERPLRMWDPGNRGISHVGQEQFVVQPRIHHLCMKRFLHISLQTQIWIYEPSAFLLTPSLIRSGSRMRTANLSMQTNNGPITLVSPLTRRKSRIGGLSFIPTITCQP